MPVVAAVDIGGTQVKVGLVESGKVLTKEVIRITNYAGAAPLLSDIAQLVKQMANCIDQKPVGVGVACAGLVDRHAGRIISSPNIPFLDNCSLTPFLSDTLGIPSSLENDAMAAAMAEYLYGGWGTPNLLVTLTLGTGVGGGVIIDGSPLRGTTNNAAEFGHLKVPGLGPRKCECGSTGCLEAYVGSRGILQTARRLWNCQRDVTHCERFPWGTVTELAKSAINGDQIAVDTLRTTGEILGRGVAMLIDVFNPDLIVVTGGVAHAFEHLEEGVQSSLRNFCAFTATKDEALIVPSEQPSDSGLLGASAAINWNSPMSRFGSNRILSKPHEVNRGGLSVPELDSPTLGLHIGASSFSASIVHPNGEIAAYFSDRCNESRADQPYERFLDQCVEAILNVLAQAQSEISPSDSVPVVF